MDADSGIKEEKLKPELSKTVTNSSDGWDDLRDEFLEVRNETEENWEDASEGSAAEKGDWSDGWDNGSANKVALVFTSYLPDCITLVIVF